MSRILRSLTAVAILAHALLGCCAHEAHAADHADCGQGHGEIANASSHRVEQPSVEDHAGQGEAYSILELGPSDCQHEPAPEAPHNCQHNSCVWTTHSDSGLDLTQLTVWFALGNCGVDQSKGFDFHRPLQSSSVDDVHFALPVRSHLALSVIRI